MIVQIDFDTIYPIWTNKLWPERVSKIEPTSAMSYLKGFECKNLSQTPIFFSYQINNIILGVNSGHMCHDRSYRSRGLYVFPEFRKQGIARELLIACINQAKVENASFVWSYPKQSALPAYLAAGFTLSSEWEKSELGINAYVRKEL